MADADIQLLVCLLLNEVSEQAIFRIVNAIAEGRTPGCSRSTGCRESTLPR